ncbi:Flp pilus assembly complex ATPase component TadA [Sphingomonas sp. JC676]|uniref:GspE/PulE family protein n=1 Tax=Sphingomonas sp. JC676 TaxID=2768065 RepID=UPI001657E226|nr:ATPase, T2SS/T4P/T4SS family [Sphingomonas sp. JC676]MBC9031135.1 Flp pilus assembly complex ATPase component TadA [Sphingomonas sp. JC676]
MNLVAEVLPAGPSQSKPLTARVSAAQGPLHALLSEATRRRATDVHVDPNPHGAGIALRIGGQIADGGLLTPQALDELVAELCAVSDLGPPGDRPQHGSVQWSGSDVAVAMLLVTGGVSLVFKLDAGDRRDRRLEALGMRQGLVAALRPALASGLVLVAGPPGSGRSTTLRALLDHAGSKARRLMLAEQVAGSPMPGAIQVEASMQCTMADILRASLRHDVDVVMVDALDDRAAAAAAVEAAQRGLLVLAAVPAGDAVGAIRRMREWRIEPFQLASTLNAVLAQRLVRRLCPECREPVQAQGSVSALLGFDRGAIVYAPSGCASCSDSGYAGQIAVFEAIHADPAMRRLINDGGDEAILASHAYVRAPNLGSAARALVREGVTTPEEAVRISRG